MLCGFFGGFMINDNKLKLRLALAEDASKLAEIYRPFVESTAISFEYIAPDADEFKRRIKEKIKTYPFIVAVIGDEIIGYAYASQFLPRPAYKHSVETTLYIKSGFQNSGIGKFLYSALEKLLALQNVINLNACIAFADKPDNTLNNNSMIFHSKMGYRYVGRFIASGYKFGRFYDMIWMEKLIRIPEDNIGDFVEFSSVFEEAEAVLLKLNSVYNKTVN